MFLYVHGSTNTSDPRREDQASCLVLLDLERRVRNAYITLCMLRGMALALAPMSVPAMGAHITLCMLRGLALALAPMAIPAISAQWASPFLLSCCGIYPPLFFCRPAGGARTDIPARPLSRWRQAPRDCPHGGGHPSTRYGKGGWLVSGVIQKLLVSTIWGGGACVPSQLG